MPRALRLSAVRLHGTHTHNLLRSSASALSPIIERAHRS
jgi:hypothetical protein